MFDLSIVIPVYNCEDYLEFFLNSLLKQNIDNYEVIIIDDCSTDNSLNIIKHFCEEFENWNYIHNHINKGLNKSRNIGLREANGEYIIFCDSDDFIPDNVFNEMLSKGKQFNCDIITGSVRKFADTPPKNTKYEYDKQNNIFIWEDDINKFIFKDIYMDLKTSITNYPKLSCNLTVWNKMYKLSLLSDYYFEEDSGINNSEGGVYSIPLLFSTSNVFILNKPVYYWRYHETSMSVKEGYSKDKLQYTIKQFYWIKHYCNGDMTPVEEYLNMCLQVIFPSFLLNLHEDIEEMLFDFLLEVPQKLFNNCSVEIQKLYSLFLKKDTFFEEYLQIFKEEYNDNYY